MDFARVFRHLLRPDWLTRKALPDAALARVEVAVAASERGHDGEIRVCVEGALGLPALLRGVDARARAIEVFSDLRVWDTEANNGVLLYLLMADRDVEIVADRGFNDRVTVAEWETVCRDMEAFFARGEFEAGLLAGIANIDALIRRHFPYSRDKANELPDRPHRV